MTKKPLTSHLLVRVLLGIVLGIACGLFFPAPIARVFLTSNGLFSAFLGFIIPLLIVGLVTPAIGDLGRGAGKWLGVTAAIAYLLQGLLGFDETAVALMIATCIAVDSFGTATNVTGTVPSP